MSKKKGVNIDIQKVISWCTSNIVLVILFVVSVAAVVGLPKVAGDWEKQVEADLKSRTSHFSKLENISNTKVVAPGSVESSRVVVNQALVDDYTAVTNSLRGDAQQVVAQANQLNRKDYTVLFAGTLFPSPTQAQSETLPQRFYRQLESNYMESLQLVRAGSPPATADLITFLEDARVRYMETSLSTRHDADLTREQRSNLEKHLSKLRMSQLRARAQDISVYFEEADLVIPLFDLTNMPSVGTLFNWQWRYWAVADIVGAIAAINDGQSVLTSPIKRVVSLEVLGLPVADAEPERGGGRGGGGASPTPPKPQGPVRPGPSPFGPGGPSSGSPPKPSPGPMGGPSGPSGPSRGSEDGQLATSYTGRKSGDLYDVLQVRLRMVVDSQRIPQVLDGLSAYNFLTIIDLDLQPEDKFVALGQGFDYGTASVSELTIVLEAAWLRAWTVEFMPDSLKRALGIKVVDE